MKTISQREARRLKKRVTELENVLENQARRWGQQYFGATQIASIGYSDAMGSQPVAVRTARALGHAVVVLGDDTGLLRLVALPHPKVFA